MHLESTIEKYFCNRVEANGGKTWKVKAIARRGFFDRIAIFAPNLVYFVELKRPKGGVWAKHQQEFYDDVTGLGGNALLLETQEKVDLFMERVTSAQEN